MISLENSNKELEIEYMEFEISLMEMANDINKEITMLYLTESDDGEKKKSNSKFVESIKKLIDKICDFIGKKMQRIGDFFGKDTGLTKEEFLNSKTGEVQLNYDLERISKEVDDNVRKGRKLVQLISKVGKVDDRVVEQYVDNCAKAVDKNGKYMIQAAAAPIMYKRAVDNWDTVRALKGKDGLFQQCKSMEGESQITKIINAMGNMASKTMNITEMYFNEYNKLSAKGK